MPTSPRLQELKGSSKDTFVCSPATWQAFHRHVLEGEPAVLVAQELGLSLNSVLLAKSRVLKRLRQELAGLVE